MLIMGSFVPWLYYSFYCQYAPKVIYLSVVTVLGSLSIIVSLWDRFAEPEYRTIRAGNLIDVDIQLYTSFLFIYGIFYMSFSFYYHILFLFVVVIYGHLSLLTMRYACSFNSYADSVINN